MKYFDSMEEKSRNPLGLLGNLHTHILLYILDKLDIDRYTIPMHCQSYHKDLANLVFSDQLG